jgi:polyisoprenoid-binding protein YceI
MNPATEAAKPQSPPLEAAQWSTQFVCPCRMTYPCHVLGGYAGELRETTMRSGWIIWPLVAALAACSPKSEQSDDRTAQAAPAASQAEAPVDVPAGSYTIDQSHTSVLFRVDHLSFSKYTARFKKASAQLQFDPKNLAASSVTVDIDTKSLETDYPNVAEHDFNAQLLSEQWLDAARHPQITFRSTKVEVTGPRTMRIHGDLTLRGVTRPMTLDARFNGGYAGHPLEKNARIGFSAHGTLKRSDFGISYGIPEPGSIMGVGDAVEVIVETEFTGPPWADAPADAPDAASTH